MCSACLPPERRGNATNSKGRLAAPLFFHRERDGGSEQKKRDRQQGRQHQRPPQRMMDARRHRAVRALLPPLAHDVGLELIGRRKQTRQCGPRPLGSGTQRDNVGLDLGNATRTHHAMTLARQGKCRVSAPSSLLHFGMQRLIAVNRHVARPLRDRRMLAGSDAGTSGASATTRMSPPNATTRSRPHKQKGCAAAHPFVSRNAAAQRLENWKLRRAFILPYFLRSTTRESRVRKPPRLSAPRRSGS